MTIAILGGGTFSDVTPHLSLCAKAFGTTAKELDRLAKTKGLDTRLYLTKMADSSSGLVSNSDVSAFVDELLEDSTITSIIFNVAMCDFVGTIEGYSLQTRLTSDKEYAMRILPDTEKVLAKIKPVRPDIYLVGFKTTAGGEVGTQILKAIQQINTCSCDLVFGNDVITRRNVLVNSGRVFRFSSRERLLSNLINDVKDHEEKKTVDTMEGYV